MGSTMLVNDQGIHTLGAGRREKTNAFILLEGEQPGQKCHAGDVNPRRAGGVFEHPPLQVFRR